MFIMFPKIKQKGFAIISAIFLIVVLAFLAVSMSRVFTSGQQAINQDITSLQAYLAGRSAQQWGMYQAAIKTVAFPAGGPTGQHTRAFSNSGLNNTEALVNLTKTTYLGKIYYKISTIGCYGYTINCTTDSTIPERSKRELEVRFVP